MTATTVLGQLPTVLSVPRKAAIEGLIDYDGDVVVEGVVIGDVRCKTLTIKERGQVDGSIVAERVIVLGEVNGQIYAGDLVLRTACSVAADIFHKQLLLEDGCFFEGKSRRHVDPLSLAS
jgi:cytoskeletal protein CcmA (bactofilin family)